MLTTPIPADLCPVHRELFRRYRENHYDPRRPTEWPGGGTLIDAHTSHAERARVWDLKNQQQMDQIAATCRSGRSPQCNRPAADAA